MADFDGPVFENSTAPQEVAFNLVPQLLLFPRLVFNQMSLTDSRWCIQCRNVVMAWRSSVHFRESNH